MPIRLQKMLMRLQLYGLSIRYKKGKELHLADTLSRHYREETRECNDTDLEVKGIQSAFERELEDATALYNLNFLLTTEDQVSVYRNATTDQGEIFQQLKRVLQAGWPEDRKSLATSNTLSILSHLGRASG